MNTLVASKRSGEGLRFLLLLSGMSMTMLVARCLLTQDFYFKLLSWNLFLAWIPLMLVLAMRQASERGWLPAGALWAGLAGWLLFLPNAPYIITDLFHVRSVSEQTLWFDTMMIFLFALTGLLAGLYSQLLVHRLLNERFGRRLTWLAMLACLVLTSFGIYLGRYGRWNSWDLVTDPLALTTAIITSFRDPVALKLTLSYTFALVVLYVGFVEYVQRHTHESLD
ncbi:DUF1361 domain-containing protein [Tellurirhabdus bombi]|uniref:DUF1361 domain-containing protein n=1 Tax=Tellurirhabdus bombi TaxID=2907205 RepID=UPI001F3A2A21|nr:DUF1361 domain-containing protein [Tellurirhabdus bombi]